MISISEDERSEAESVGLGAPRARARRLEWSQRFWVDLAWLFLLSWGLRAIGANWGATTADENIGQAVRVLAGDFFPDQLFYPQVGNYVTAVACAALFLGGRLLGIFHSVSDFQDLYFSDPLAFFVAGRVAHAGISALLGPIGYLMGVGLGLSRARSILMGLVGAFIPVTVWFAHQAKPQNGMMVGCVVACAFALAYLDKPGRRWAALGLGVATGVAGAFMHSAIFFAVPLGAVTLLYGAVRAGSRPVQVLRDAGVAAGAAALSWAVLSIPLIVKMQSFIDYQIIQSQVSLRESEPELFLNASLPILSSWVWGFGPVGLALAVLTAFLAPNRAVRWLTGGLLIGLLVLAWIVGDRPLPRLFMPFTASLLMLAGLSLLDLTRSPVRWRAGAAWAGLFLLLAGQVGGSAEVVRQALGSPAAMRATEVVASITKPESTKILVPDLGSIRLPQNYLAAQETFERHLRLGKKYGVEIPPRSPRRLLALEKQRGYHIREMPWVLGGLEYYKPEEVKVIKAFSWPVQYEEWKLDYWLDAGYEVFVLWKVDSYTSEGSPDYVAEFFRETISRCEEVARVDGDRWLFFEENFLILRNCSGSPDASDIVLSNTVNADAIDPGLTD